MTKKRSRTAPRRTTRSERRADAARGSGADARAGATAGEAPAIGAGLAAAIFGALSLAYFLSALLPGGHLFGSDYFAASYHYMEWLSDEFARGSIPKWLPYVYGGMPWFANAGATWYPPRLLGDLFLPAYKLFAFMYFVQVAAAGTGAFLLFRELRCRPWVSLVSALGFQFTGLMLSFTYAGHDGRMIVASFAPLFFFFLHRGIRTGGLGAFAGASATLGAAMLSNQIQSVYYLLIAGALWSGFALWHMGHLRAPRALARRVALGLAAVALAFALAAVNFLPFLGYVDASPRGGEGRGLEYATSWSMAPAEVLSMAVPEQAGILGDYRGDAPGANPFKLHTEYVGAFALLLLALGMFYSRRDKRWWFFLALALFALSVALGRHTPIYRLYYEFLPGTKRFRAPSISFFLVAFSLAAMAALTLERLAALRGPDARGRSARRGTRGEAGGSGMRVERAPWVALGAVALALAGAAIGPGSSWAAANAGAGWLRFTAFAAAIAGILWLWIGARASTTLVTVLLGVTIVADLWIVDRNFYEMAQPPGVHFRADGVADFLAQEAAGTARVWTLPSLAQLPAYRGQTNYLMRFGVEQVTGEHGNQLQRWNEYLGASPVTYTDQHNVLGELQRFATSGGTAATPLLNAANVGYVVASANVGLPWPVVFQDGSGVVYQNPAALPRAYLVPGARVTGPDGSLEAISAPDWDPRATAILEIESGVSLADGGGSAGVAQILEHQSDRYLLRVDARAPAILVLAETHYPDWRVRVDGDDAELLRVNHALMGVAVEPGEHSVELAFRPDALYRGLWISLAALLLLVAVGAWSAWAARRPRSPRPEAGPDAAAA
ncbi:MAG: YfhO family protein [Gemmatimonadota bacterium]